MATAPTNSLIMALRAATPAGAAKPGFTFYANPQNGSAVTPYNYTGMAFDPPVLGRSTGGTPPPSGGGGGDGGGGAPVTDPDIIDTIIDLPRIVDDELVPDISDDDIVDVVDDPVVDPERPDVVDDTTDETTDTIIDTGLVLDDPVADNTSNTDSLDLTDRIDNDFIDRLNEIDFGELDPPMDFGDREGIVEINQDNVDYDGYSSFEDPNSVDAVNGADLESDLYGIYDDEEFLQQLERLNSQDSDGSGDPSSDFWRWNRLYGVDGAGGGGGPSYDQDLLDMLAGM